MEICSQAQADAINATRTTLPYVAFNGHTDGGAGGVSGG
jgi:hypothetical protein